MSRRLGYAIERENRRALAERGEDPRRLLARVANAHPQHKAPESAEAIKQLITACKNQGDQGSCQGQSLSLCFSWCFWMATGRWFNFSAQCAYILSQRADGLLGRDVGSTLSGGQEVATQVGLCLEEDWRYPNPARYQPRIVTEDTPYRLASAKATNDTGLIKEALQLGLVVQTGLAWNNEMEQEVVEQYTGRRAMGGHSTYFVGWKDGDTFQPNSWGTNVAGDGINRIRGAAIDDCVKFPGNVFVIYGPDGMEYPELPPVPME